MSLINLQNKSKNSNTIIVNIEGEELTFEQLCENYKNLKMTCKDFEATNKYPFKVIEDLKSYRQLTHSLQTNIDVLKCQLKNSEEDNKQLAKDMNDKMLECITKIGEVFGKKVVPMDNNGTVLVNSNEKLFIIYDKK